MAAINKLVRGTSTAGDIFNSVNGIIDVSYSAVKQRFLEALSSDSEYTYIVTGDSTRKSGELDSSDYYDPQLSKINFSLVMNSSGGQSAENWKNNIGNSTLQQAIDATPGTGSTAVLEMSLGINPPNGVASEIKQHIIDGLTEYLASKPDALIIFCSPVETGTPVNDELNEMYKTLPAEFNNSIYVSGKAATQSVHQNNDYYLDFTHPNFNGQRRLVNYIFNTAMPAECKMLMSIEDSEAVASPGNLGFTVVNGNWYVGGGDILRLDSGNTDRRATSKISVEPNFIVKLDTGGDNAAYIFADDDDNVISSGTASIHDGSDGAYRSVVVPIGASKLAYSFSNDGDAWDALNYQVDISYIVIPTVFMKQPEVNQGNLVGLPYIQNQSLDDAGSIGTSGQVKTAQGDGTWLWV